MKMRVSRLIRFAVLLVLAAAGPAAAQLFGPRTLGQPLSRRSGPAAQSQEQAGSLQGNERFLRGNRRRTDFVGVDRADASTFVGMEQAGQARSERTAVEGLRERRAPRTALNQPRGPLGPNELREKLVLSDEIAATEGLINRQEVSRRLSESLTRLSDATIAVSVAGQTAILRGTVASARARDLAELIVSFEPGIVEIDNRLQVQASPIGLPARPANPLPSSQD
jgi:hypothetical protein